MKGILYTKISDSSLSVKLSNKYYEKSAVYSASQKFTNDYSIKINEYDADTVEVIICTKNREATINDFEQSVSAFCNEVLDQQIRLDVERQYGNIRELIVQQAFSPITVSDLSERIKKPK